MSTVSLAKIASAQTVVTTTELVIGTVTVLTGVGSAGVWFSGDVQITPGAGTTALTFRLRQTNLTGAIVDNTAAVPVTASVATQVPFNLYDLTNAPEQAGGQLYVLTVQQTGATGNGTVNGGHLGVED